jgi:hypothetical protein
VRLNIFSSLALHVSFFVASSYQGGLAAGIVVGWTIFAWEIENKCWKVIWFLVGFAATVASFSKALDYLYSGNITPTNDLLDVCQYYKNLMGGNYACTCQRN